MDCALTALVFFALGLAVPIWLRRQKEKNLPLKLMGTEIPEIKGGLNLEKRYDLSFHKDEKPDQHLQVKILGSVDRDSDSMFGATGRWLVVEFPDGRRAYVPWYSITAIQESGAM